MIEMVPSFSEPQAIYIHLRCVFDACFLSTHELLGGNMVHRWGEITHISLGFTVIKRRNQQTLKVWARRSAEIIIPLSSPIIAVIIPIILY